MNVYIQRVIDRDGILYWNIYVYIFICTYVLCIYIVYLRWLNIVDWLQLKYLSSMYIYI